jgi:hypothetical protein
MATVFLENKPFKISFFFVAASILIGCLTSVFIQASLISSFEGREIRSDLFSLEPTPQGFSLNITLEGQKKALTIERGWLIPPDEEEEEEFAYVTSFSFNRIVNSFPVGNGKIGLHLSSFEAMSPGTGSAMAAAGRDVFLIFDPEKNMISQGIVDLGITKDRVRTSGNFSAVSHHFLIADINQDGCFDLGIIREEMASEHCYDEQREVDVVSGPFYKQFPVKWHLFDESKWIHESAFDGKLDCSYEELPLIEIKLLPIDFAAHTTWNTYDSKCWAAVDPSLPKFFPEYRKKLFK